MMEIKPIEEYFDEEPYRLYQVRISRVTESGRFVHLDVVYDYEYSGLWQLFDNPTDMRKFIVEKTDEAFIRAIRRIDADHFILNCSEGDAFLDGLQTRNKLIDIMINSFMPIIAKFLHGGIIPSITTNG